MDFAEPMLKLNMDGRLIKYLGRVHDARALRALMYCLEKGVKEAAESLVTNAEGIDKSKLSAADTKIAVKALQDVMEYMEVSHLRGGVAAHMKKEDNYVGWKALQARAGKAMLKLHQPEEAPIPAFDPLYLDLSGARAFLPAIGERTTGRAKQRLEGGHEPPRPARERRGGGGFRA